MIKHVLLRARLEYYELADAAVGSADFLKYIRHHQIDVASAGGFAGATAVLPIGKLGDQRFNFDPDGDLAFVCEAYAVDGESIVDLVAWLLNEPGTPLTMFGRGGLLGLWQAMAPGTYFMGGSLRLHWTPLKWLQAGCDGAAVVDPHLAGQELLVAPGPIAAEDQAHGRDIVKLLRSAAAIDNKVIAPFENRRVA
ncbi:hypothetical protein [Mesorhizobium sp.]|uniref:hypothetical protein n=1 Tax=Mesorhizobium sp. TaxID=1871066 RepID=UPI000FE5984B|nr:hypothetical protein [Mesorhizobium sp.]RWO41376.1 MAG: hypothetical protein EOS13_32255 [Mesorhizobium sp.]